MAISIDWQIINNLTYNTFSSIDETPYTNNNMLTVESAERLASAIGWEVVELSTYVSTVSTESKTYNASDIRALRPVANSGEAEYTYGFILGRLYYSAGAFSTGFINLTTGSASRIQSQIGSVASISLLRPSANGVFVFRETNSLATNKTLLFDKFYNVKTGNVKWGILQMSYAEHYDMFSGIWANNISYPSRKTKLFAEGGFVMLSKLTVITSQVIYKAMNMYRELLGYSNTEKTIELDGTTYINLNSMPIYIPLD